MKLTSVQISNYKCIRDACGFDVSDITCLVGMNESGKTAILEALYRLNPIVPDAGRFNVDDDYPRVDVEDYRVETAGGRRQPALVTRAVFSLSDDDRKELEKDFPGALIRPEMVLSRGYDNELRMEVPVNEEPVVQALLRNAGLSQQELRARARFTTLSELAGTLPENDPGEAIRRLSALAAEMREKGISVYLAEKYLARKVPRFMYFDQFYQMAGHVNIEALIQRQKENKLLDSDYPLLGLIDLARLDLAEIVNPRRAQERDNRLEGASNHLTETIMRYWSQNRYLEMRFDIRPGLPHDPKGMKTGTNLWCHVYNARQKVRTLLGSRSRGFLWFFSFLAWFSQHKKRGMPLVLLLDEPDLFLHGTAQRDLLRYLEDESKAGNQVVYTTQSPYMIDAHRFDRVRVVEDRGAQENAPPSSERAGTSVCKDVRDASAGSVLPLYTALADGLRADFLPGPDTLLVGDVVDLLLLRAVSSLLVAGGAPGLDPRWRITPIGGAARLAALLQLAGDQRSGISSSSMILRKSEMGSLGGLLPEGLLDQRRIHFYGAFTATEDADIEDLFDTEFYLGLVNSEYRDGLSRQIKKSHLPAEGGRLSVMIASCFETLARRDEAPFDRFRPARYFLENSSSLLQGISDETWLRFQKMFEAINAGR